MHARVSSYSGAPDQAQAVIRSFEGTTDALRSLDGFDGGYLLLDRGTGKVLTITLWSSEDAAQASADRGSQIRTEAAGEAGISIESVETYEVAMQVQPGG
jgi:heme-degrading monooxygenase HmoA